eukprot:SM000188S03810  [mRNA]  locus=s188:69553:70509:- [translate_table: standard]
MSKICRARDVKAFRSGFRGIEDRSLRPQGSVGYILLRSSGNVAAVSAHLHLCLERDDVLAEQRRGAAQLCRILRVELPNPQCQRRRLLAHRADVFHLLGPRRRGAERSSSGGDGAGIGVAVGACGDSSSAPASEACLAHARWCESDGRTSEPCHGRDDTLTAEPHASPPSPAASSPCAGLRQAARRTRWGSARRAALVESRFVNALGAALSQLPLSTSFRHAYHSPCPLWESQFLLGCPPVLEEIVVFHLLACHTSAARQSWAAGGDVQLQCTTWRALGRPLTPSAPSRCRWQWLRARLSRALRMAAPRALHPPSRST